MIMINMRNRIAQVLTALIERGKGIEVNTSGLRQGAGGNPCPESDALSCTKRLEDCDYSWF